MWDNSLMYNVHWGEDCEGFNSNLWPLNISCYSGCFCYTFRMETVRLWCFYSIQMKYLMKGLKKIQAFLILDLSKAMMVLFFIIFLLFPSFWLLSALFFFHEALLPVGGWLSHPGTRCGIHSCFLTSYCTLQFAPGFASSIAENVIFISTRWWHFGAYSSLGLKSNILPIFPSSYRSILVPPSNDLIMNLSSTVIFWIILRRPRVGNLALVEEFFFCLFVHVLRRPLIFAFSQKGNSYT